MTGSENERLAVVETKIAALGSDITEIKADVKSLVIAQATLTTALAERETAAKVRREARASTGVWVRAVVPWLLVGGSLVISVISLSVTLHII